MKIKILCFGKMSPKLYNSIYSEYQKRISKYANLEIIELKEEFNSDIEKNKFKNTESLIKNIEKYSDYEFIVMDVSSKISSSEDLATIIENNKNLKSGKLVFIVGPSDGYHKIINELKLMKVSFGKITLPHELFRIVLLEQIYRSFKIINNEKYHK